MCSFYIPVFEIHRSLQLVNTFDIADGTGQRPDNNAVGCNPGVSIKMDPLQKAAAGNPRSGKKGIVSLYKII